MTGWHWWAGVLALFGIYLVVSVVAGVMKAVLDATKWSVARQADKEIPAESGDYLIVADEKSSDHDGNTWLH